MPTSMLDSGAAVGLPRRVVQIRVVPAVPVDLLLEARTEPGGGSTVRQPMPGLVVLPSVGAPVVVSVRSRDGSPFPATAVVSVEVTSGQAAAADPDRATLSQVRLGGLLERELVVVSGAGAGLEVRASGRAAVEVELGRLGNAARAAASSLLGSSVVPEEDAVNLVVAVDRSASFRPRLDDGSLRVVLGLLSGVAAAVVGPLRIGVALVGDDVAWVEAPALGALAPAVEAGLRAARPSGAFRSGAAALSRFDPERNTVVYLLTDDVPGDLDALEAAGEQEGEARHVVAVCAGSVRQAGRATALPLTRVEPRPGLEDRLLADPAALTAVVRSLLQGCFAPGSASFDRIAS